MNPYLGSSAQLYGVEEMRLVGGKGDGMRLLQVRNGKGLEFTVSCDRAADLPRLSLDGVNFAFFTPCGYVSPAYYDPKGEGFLKSFTAGFLTTCGLYSVGEPCCDGGEELGLHGTISNIPAEQVFWEVGEEEIVIRARMRDASALGREVVLDREYRVSLLKNEMSIRDRVENRGFEPVPYQILYHFNLGYPLLSETARLTIPSKRVLPRNGRAAEHIGHWQELEVPQKGYEEMCFYHEMEKDARVRIFNPAVGVGFEMRYDAEKLPCFTQWKQMAVRDYVTGLEPGNAYPDGRDVMRKTGRLTFLEPAEHTEHTIILRFLRSEEEV